VSEASYRLVIADDHPLFRGALRAAVSGQFAGAEIAEAGTFDDVVRELERGGEVDLVLLDLAMPRKDGFAVARELKMDPGTANTPLVALTALAMRGDDERVLQAGFDGYLPKPLERAALDATLARIFAHA
jgi:CheY-like chemotaxis protein